MRVGDARENSGKLGGQTGVPDTLVQLFSPFLVRLNRQQV